MSKTLSSKQIHTHPLSPPLLSPSQTIVPIENQLKLFDSKFLTNSTFENMKSCLILPNCVWLRLPIIQNPIRYKRKAKSIKTTNKMGVKKIFGDNVLGFFSSVAEIPKVKDENMRNHSFYTTLIGEE